jgi:hypothetical protein
MIQGGRVFTFAWTESELDKTELPEQYAAACHEGVWDCGIAPSLEENLKNIIDEPRGKTCFFYHRFVINNYWLRMINSTASLLRFHLRRSNLYI